MPRPKSKGELLNLSKENFKKLNDFVAQYSATEQNKDFPKGTLNRNIRDVLIHLHQWHLLIMNWYNVGMAGEKPIMPAEGYTWKTLPAFNKWVREKYKAISLAEAKERLNDSYKQVREIIESHSDKELFEKKKYKWTGSTSLGAYFISNTSSHYTWALKLIKKTKK